MYDIKPLENQHTISVRIDCLICEESARPVHFPSVLQSVHTLVGHVLQERWQPNWDKDDV